MGGAFSKSVSSPRVDGAPANRTEGEVGKALCALLLLLLFLDCFGEVAAAAFLLVPEVLLEAEPEAFLEDFFFFGGNVSDES